MSEEKVSYKKSWCIAKSNQTFISEKIPVKKEKISLPCPGYAKKCPSEEIEWRCHKCGFFIEYGYGEYFFCLCGAALISSYSFRCSNANHGNEFLVFSESELQKRLPKKST